MRKYNAIHRRATWVLGNYTDQVLTGAVADHLNWKYPKHRRYAGEEFKCVKDDKGNYLWVFKNGDIYVAIPKGLKINLARDAYSTTRRNPYRVVTFYVKDENGKLVDRTIGQHVLMATCWLGEGNRRDEGDGMQVNHKDGNPFNNKPSNLEWVTRQENEEHKHVMNELRRLDEENPSLGLTTQKIIGGHLVNYLNKPLSIEDIKEFWGGDKGIEAFLEYMQNTKWK